MVKKIIISSLLCYTTMYAEAFTLGDAANEIVHTHPEVKEKLHSFKAAIETHKYSKAGYLPTIDFQVSLGSETTKSQTTRDEYETLLKRETSLKLVENLFNGFATKNDVLEQKEKYISASLEIIEKANAITLRVSQTYLNILKYKNILALEQENIQNYEKILGQIQEKVKGGFSPLSDSLQVQTRYTLAKASLQTTKNSLENELAKFHKLLGRFLALSDFEEPTYDFSVPLELNNAIKFALKNNPTIKIANHTLKAKKYSYEKMKKTKWPTIDAIFKAENNENTGALEGSTERYYAGIELKYNIFNGFADTTQEQKEISLLHKEHELRNGKRRDIIESVILAFKTYNDLVTKETILTQHVEFAKQTNDAYYEEFRIGKRTLLDVLNIETEYNTAQKEFTTNKYEKLTAKYELLSYLGTLSNKIGVNVDNIANLRYSDKNSRYKRDTLPLNLEADKDKIVDMVDICDKSLSFLGNINSYGCSRSVSQEIIPSSIKKEVTKKEEPVVSSFLDTPVPHEDTLADIPEEDSLENLFIEETPTIEKTSNVTLDNEFIYFQYGSSKLTNNSKRLLDILVAKFRDNPRLKIKLTGYTDNRGPERRNIIRSRSRANTVKKYLVAHGVSRRTISTNGVGSANPIASNETKEGRSKNRRVEFELINDTPKSTSPTPVTKVTKREKKPQGLYPVEEMHTRKQQRSHTTRVKNTPPPQHNNPEDMELIEIDF